MLCADLEFLSSCPHPHHHHYSGNPGPPSPPLPLFFPPPLSLSTLVTLLVSAPLPTRLHGKPGHPTTLTTMSLVILATPPPFLPSSPSLPLLPFPPLPSCPHLSPFPLWAASPPWPPHCPCSQQDCLCQVPVLQCTCSDNVN